MSGIRIGTMISPAIRIAERYSTAVETDALRKLWNANQSEPEQPASIALPGPVKPLPQPKAAIINPRGRNLLPFRPRTLTSALNAGDSNIGLEGFSDASSRTNSVEAVSTNSKTISITRTKNWNIVALAQMYKDAVSKGANIQLSQQAYAPLRFMLAQSRIFA